MAVGTWVRSRFGVVGLVVALGVGTALAQAPGQSPSGGTPQQQPGGAQPGANSPNSLNSPGGALSQMGQGNDQASLQDKDFLKAAGQGGNFEIKAGQLAMKNSSSEDVKQFGQMMVTDHTKLNDGMKPVAMQAGVSAPTGMSKKQKMEYKKLQGLTGDAFDKEYIPVMLEDHTKDLEAFKSEASNGQLPAEKTAAMQGAQVVEKHLQAIKQIAQAHNMPSSSGM